MPTTNDARFALVGAQRYGHRAFPGKIFERGEVVTVAEPDVAESFRSDTYLLHGEHVPMWRELGEGEEYDPGSTGKAAKPSARARSRAAKAS